jgi:hypothetical protein
VSKSGGEFVTTGEPHSQDAITVRDADLRYIDGKLEGTVKLTFRGGEALRWRLEERDNDEAARRKDLEQELSHWLPSGSTVDLGAVTGWTSSEEPLTAEYKVSVPGVVTQTGKRLLVPVGLFESNDTHPFRHASRRLPVYFSYPFREIDNVTIELPGGFQLEATPQTRDFSAGFAIYQRVASFVDNKINLQRRLQMDGYIFMPEQYSSLRAFYDTVRAGDEETLVMKSGPQ